MKFFTIDNFEDWDAAKEKDREEYKKEEMKHQEVTQKELNNLKAELCFFDTNFCFIIRTKTSIKRWISLWNDALFTLSWCLEYIYQFPPLLQSRIGAGSVAVTMTTCHTAYQIVCFLWKTI